MSAFTFTAPIITEEQEREEREALSEEERKQVKDDIYGTETLAEESQSMIEVGLHQMQEALSCMADDEKLDYLKAVEHGVDSESPWIAFLRYTHYDPWAAAAAMAHYWFLRREIFGDTRAFLPMTLEGAMAEDVEYLEKAFSVWHPKKDAQGRHVLVIDRIRMVHQVAPRDSIIRVQFYLCHVMMCDEDARRRGVVMVVNLRSYDLYKHFDRIQSKKRMRLWEAMPLNWKCCHLCTGSGASVLDIVLPVLKHMAGREMRLRYRRHSGSTSEVLATFSDYGLDKSHVDCIFGGYSKSSTIVNAWIDERRRKERLATR